MTRRSHYSKVGVTPELELYRCRRRQSRPAFDGTVRAYKRKDTRGKNYNTAADNGKRNKGAELHDSYGRSKVTVTKEE